MREKKKSAWKTMTLKQYDGYCWLLTLCWLWGVDVLSVTGASFVVFNGALKASSGFIAKSSIVEGKIKAVHKGQT